MGQFLPIVRIGTPALADMHEYLQAIAIRTVKLNNVLVPSVEAFGCVAAHCAEGGDSFRSVLFWFHRIREEETTHKCCCLRLWWALKVQSFGNVHRRTSATYHSLQGSLWHCT